MLISIVIPHLNQARELEACLSSIESQTGFESELEIIVVDNGSQRMPVESCHAREGVRLTREPTPGPGPARNRGAELACGSLLAFIDADCRAGDGWIASIERAFQDQQQQIVGGPVRVWYQDPDRPKFHEPYEAIYSFRNEEHIAEGFSGTGNLAMRAEVLQAVGPFAGIEVAEDREWGLRAGTIGYRTNLIEGMVVFHPTRTHYRGLTQKWDRHIAHDYAEVSTRNDKLRWCLKALALAISPLIELRTIAGSHQVSGVWERALALGCLTRLRLYRARRMYAVFIARDKQPESSNWNRH